MERTIRVTGKGKLSVKPDLTRLVMTLEGIDRDYGEMLHLSSNYTDFLKDIFVNFGFKRSDLKTLYFNVDTQYSHYWDKKNDSKRRFEGYKFVHRMKVEFPIDNELLGKLLFALANCRVNPKFKIEYTIADKEKSKNELLASAVEDSKNKAEVLSKAAGVTLGDIQIIDYSWGEIDFVTRPMNDMIMECETRVAEPMGASYDLDIEPDNIDVTDTVTVVWKIQ